MFQFGNRRLNVYYSIKFGRGINHWYSTKDTIIDKICDITVQKNFILNIYFTTLKYFFRAFLTVLKNSTSNFVVSSNYILWVGSVKKTRFSIETETKPSVRHRYSAYKYTSDEMKTKNNRFLLTELATMFGVHKSINKLASRCIPHRAGQADGT